MRCYSRLSLQAPRRREGTFAFRRSVISQRLVRDERGTIAVMFGAAASFLLLAAGGAVDVGRIYGANQRLQSALDAAVIAAARGAFPGRRLLLAFQPHRYTRTRDCFEDYVKVMGSADAVVLTEVYSAGEAAIVAADGRTLARALRVAGKVDPVFEADVEALPTVVLEQARGGDVVIVMGAGSIGHAAARIAELGNGGQP